MLTHCTLNTVLNTLAHNKSAEEVTTTFCTALGKGKSFVVWLLRLLTGDDRLLVITAAVGLSSGNERPLSKEVGKCRRVQTMSSGGQS